MTADSRLRLLHACLAAFALLAIASAPRADGASAGGGAAAPSARALPPGAALGSSGPSLAIFPRQSIALRFDHRRHLARSLACLDCHPLARTSDSASDRLLPAPSVCDRCHGTLHAGSGAVVPRDGARSCGLCHEGWAPEHGQRVARTNLPAPQLVFGHRAHARRNIGCGQCHGAVERLGLATRDQLPRMNGCLRCHNLPAQSRGDARAECSTCHLSRPDGRLVTHLATGRLLPPRWLGHADHVPSFLASGHGRVAGDRSRLCASCHTEDDCARCHDGRVRPRGVHPNDWLSMHPVAARQDSPRCSSCHHAQSFCRACHLRVGVTETGPTAQRRSQGRMHPPSAVFTTGPRTPRHHAWEAQRNLTACVSCHSERDCATCHATRGMGGGGFDPHPPGFAARCSAALRRNPRPCWVCHEPSDPSLGACR